MSSHIWVRSDGILKLLDFGGNFDLQSYSSFDEGSDILHARVENNGVFSKLKPHFVLGKVKFWEGKGHDHRTPFVRVDNHPAYPNGVIMSPNSWISVRYNRGGKTIDQTTPLSRVELLHAPGEDFVRRAFETYYSPVMSWSEEHGKHFILYCNESALVRAKIG